MQINNFRVVVSYLFLLGAQTIFIIQGSSFLAPEQQEGHVMKHIYSGHTIQLAEAPCNQQHMHSKRAGLLPAALTHYFN